MVKSCVYFGSVMHMRLKPRRHLFRYNVFSLFLDIDKLAEFDKTSWFFRLNRWGMVSLYEKDHGGEPLLFGLILVLFILYEPLGIYGRWLKIKLFFEMFPTYKKQTFKKQKTFTKSDRV